MDYLEIAPAPALAPWVRCLWMLAAPAPDGEAPVEKILPDGSLDIIVHVGVPYRHVGPTAGTPPRARTLLAGQLHGFIQVQQVAALDMVGVRFHPAGAWPFLRCPLDALNDRVVPLDELSAELAATLTAAVDACDEPLDRLAALEAVLLARRPSREQRDLLVETAAARLAAGVHAPSIGALARELGVSGRQLSRRFDERVGLGPKTLARTLRFQQVFAVRERLGAANWARLAVDCGFSDQAHLIREFRRFSGERPPELVAGDRGLTHRMLAGGVSVFAKPAG